MSVGTTKLVLKLVKASNFQFKQKTLHFGLFEKVQIPSYRSIGGQRGKGFDAFAQVIGRTTFSFLDKCVWPASEHVGADLLAFCAPEIEEIDHGRKKLKTAAKKWEDKSEKTAV